LPATTLILHPGKALAIVPAHLQPIEESQEPVDVIPVMGRWVRGALLGMAIGLGVVFYIALRLDPYENGKARTMETHMQLGLPPCNFKLMTGLPCPSCGMTTSFALLVRGDLTNSLRANAVGTLLAVFCMTFIPWGLYSAIRGRSLFIVSLERTVTWIVVSFMVLLLIRWLIVLGLMWWNGKPS
jgi:hypothetical protein